MNGRLLLLQLRRHPFRWLFPAVALLFGLAVGWAFERPVVLWADSSLLVRTSVWLLGPLSAAAAAALAGRERQWWVDDLIASTPLPALSRALAAWVATSLVAVAAYGLVAAYVFGRTAARATWGGPEASVVLVGLVAILAAAALGHALGRVAPGQIVPVLAAVALALALGLPAAVFRSWLALFSPMGLLDASAWYGVRPNVVLPQALVLAGVAGLGLAAIARASDRHPVAGRLLFASVAVCAVGVALIRAASPADGAFGLEEARWDGTDLSQPLPYEPVCSDAPLPVCVHPAYEPLLADASQLINELAAPLVGIPGAPTRAVQVPNLARPAPEGTVGFELEVMLTPGNDWTTVSYDVAHGLTMDGYHERRAARVPAGDGSSTGGVTVRFTRAQYIVADWLLQRLDRRWGPICEEEHVVGGGPCADNPFLQLDPAEQRAWLEQNFAALRIGELEEADLP